MMPYQRLSFFHTPTRELKGRHKGLLGGTATRAIRGTVRLPSRVWDGDLQ